MDGIPKDQLVRYRDQAIEALHAVMTSGTSYELTHPDGSRQKVTRANIREIREAIDFFQQQIMILEGTGGPVNVRPNF